jgi:hypothetical protein
MDMKGETGFITFSDERCVCTSSLAVWAQFPPPPPAVLPERVRDCSVTTMCRDAKDAVERLHNTEFQGRTISVTWGTAGAVLRTRLRRAVCV